MTPLENQLRYSVIVAVITSAIVAYVVSALAVTHCDGLVKSGYFPVTFKDRGQTIKAMVPMYMNNEEFIKTRGKNEN